MEETQELVKVECPTCKGEGIIYELDYDDENVSMTSYRERKCPECNGFGYVDKAKGDR